VNPPVLLPPQQSSRTCLACATCGEPITSASPIVFLMHYGLGRKMSVKVCWECAEIHLENPQALEVQFQMMLSR